MAAFHSSKRALFFSCFLLVVQMSAFAAAAAGFFENPGIIAPLIPTLIANLAATAFQLGGAFAFREPTDTLDRPME